MTAAYLAYHILELNQMRVHQYYMLPALIFLVPMAAAGAIFLYRMKNWKPVVSLLLIAAPVLATIRIIPARWWRDDLGIPKEFADKNQLKELQTAVPENAMIVTGPDPSGCIFFYFLNKKGYSYSKPEDVEQNPVALQKFKGANYVYAYRHTLPPSAAELIAIKSNWNIYRIK